MGSGGVGAPLPLASPPNDHLIVGGDLDAQGGWQVFNGNAVYGDSLTAAPSTPCTGCDTFQGTPIDFSAAEADLLAKSAAWDALPANGSSVLSFSTLELTGTDPDLNVFEVTENDWETSTNKQISIPSGSTVLINIQGSEVSYSGGLSLNGNNNPAAGQADLANVLYHFPDATSVENNNIALLGSLLAPHAELTLNGGGVNGVGIAASVIQQSGGEFHNFPFTGDIPVVPEPAAGIMLLGGMSLLLARRLR